MDEAESLCDEIAIMDRGKIIHQGTPSCMLEEHFDGVLLSIPSSAEGKLEAAEIRFQKKNHLVEILTTDVDGCIKKLLENNVSLDGLQVRSPNLEDLFIKLTGHKLRN